MEEIKRRKTDEDAVMDLSNEPSMHSTPSHDVLGAKSINQNEELVPLPVEPLPSEISAETPVKGMVDARTNGSPSRTPEQNSSGFGDEIVDGENHVEEENNNLTTDIFQTDHISFSDRLEAYGEIFSRHSQNVHERLHEYLTENVLFSGWKAIWKIEKGRKKGLNECSILVEVDAAPATLSGQLKACVHLAKPVCCIVGGELCEGKEADSREGKIRELLSHLDDHVDLIDLYPVFDESGMLDETALALEHARFFYQHLWRSMDDEDDISSSSFMDKFLKQRLKFYFDVKDRRVPAHIVKQHTQALVEYKAKCKAIKGLQGQLQDGDVSDVELDMNESRIAVDIMGLHDQVETLNKTLDKLESPFLRSLMNIPSGFLSESSPETKFFRSDRSLKTFLVADKLTVGMIQGLNLSADIEIEHCQLPGDALAKSYSGDTILIFPGRYSGTGFYNLRQAVSVKGLGSKSDTVIVCEELADIFVDCEANAMISNITLEDENWSTSHGLVAVRPGSKLVLIDCILRKGCIGATVFGGGVLEMRGCEIQGIQKHGVRCKSGSSIQISDCVIRECGLVNQKEDKEGEEEQEDTNDQLVGGIMIEIQESDEKGDQTTLTITDSKILDNYSAGIVVVHPSQCDDPEPITTDVIDLLEGVKVDSMKGIDFENNTLGEVMLANADSM